MHTSNSLPSSPEVLRSWFLNQALPFWSRYGVDHKAGGFYEKLHPTNLKPTIEPRRTRLVARQIYWFAAGGALGWEGPFEELIDHGFQFLHKYLVEANGQVRASCAPSGTVVDNHQYLYDVAFVLVALAKLAERKPDLADPEVLARRIVMRLEPHPLGGYLDAITPELQCTNPHMHLFEAFLAWASLSNASQEFWQQCAAALAQLALERLILPQSGAIPEHFDRHWLPLRQSGFYRIEPGHQFEWSWLLARWAVISGDSSASDAAARLCSFGEAYGVDSNRNVAIECISDQYLPCDYTARLWQQTERLKAWHFQAFLTGSPAAIIYRDKALESLFHFISESHPGLWSDEMDPSGSFIMQPVKASSGYHIACAIEVLFHNPPFATSNTWSQLSIGDD
jgi:mannose/cellobiose epimerase-like protein (N-acyl-D-glucosamine 2-epimerase family)